MNSLHAVCPLTSVCVCVCVVWVVLLLDPTRDFGKMSSGMFVG